MSQELWVTVTGSGLAGGIIGFWLNQFFGPYVSEKGKNLARKEDIAVLRNEVQVLTKEAEFIKAQITDRVWDRQKRWEAKQQAYIGLLIALNAAIDAEIGHRTHWNAVGEAGDNLDLRTRRLEQAGRAVDEKRQALRDLSRAIFTASITAGPSCVALLNELTPILGRAGEGTLNRTGGDEDLDALYAILNRLQVVAREDLKVHFQDV